MNLQGNTVAITGGTSGIGLAFAEEFLHRGNKVIICGRREERLRQLSQRGIFTRVCDVADDHQRVEFSNWIIREHPETNILVNNAGIQLMADVTRPVDMERLRSEVDINFIAPVHLSSLLTGQLSGKPGAAIINISSGLAFSPLAFLPVYCATKAAIHSFSLSLRHQVKGMGIRVFEIAPPAVDTELGSDRRADKSQSHGGMPVAEFIREAMVVLEKDIFEYAVGPAENMRSKRESLFESMNNR